MPYANKELRISRTNFHNNYANLAINPQTFENLKQKINSDTHQFTK